MRPFLTPYNLPAALVLASVVALGPLGSACAAGGSGGGSGGGGGGGGGGSTGGSSVRIDGDMPGEVLVKLTTTAALNPLLNKYALTLISQFGARPIYRLRVTGSAKPKDVVTALSLEPGVAIAETNGVHVSPEARYNLPWAIGNPSAYMAQWAPQAMRLTAAQALSTGAGVRVAVLDTGADLSHPALAGRLLPGRDFVDGDNDPSEVGNPLNYPAYGHGTHVAGLVALVAPDARIMPLRVLDPNGMGNAWVLSEALLYAIDPDGNPATDDGAHVINVSLGSLARTRMMAAISNLATCGAAIPDDPIADQSDPGYNDDKVRCANGHGAVIVAAAGNDASSAVKEYPAAEGAYGLVAIAASNGSRRLASFSNSGSWVTLAAPGEGITSAVPGGWGTWSGTSMAAPLAAGTAALVRAIEPSMPARDVARRITRSSAMLCNTNLRQVDALAAVTGATPANVTCP